MTRQRHRRRQRAFGSPSVLLESRVNEGAPDDEGVEGPEDDDDFEDLAPGKGKGRGKGDSTTAPPLPPTSLPTSESLTSSSSSSEGQIPAETTSILSSPTSIISLDEPRATPLPPSSTSSSSRALVTVTETASISSKTVLHSTAAPSSVPIIAQSGSNGLSAGQIAGIVVGLIVCLLLAAGSAFLVYRRRRRRYIANQRSTSRSSAARLTADPRPPPRDPISNLDQAAKDVEEPLPERESHLFNNPVGLGILQQPKPAAARISRWLTEFRQSYLPSPRSPRSPRRRPSVVQAPYYPDGKYVDDDDDAFSDTSSILSPVTFVTRHTNSTYLPPTALTHPSVPKLLAQQQQQQPQQQLSGLGMHLKSPTSTSTNTTTTTTSSSSTDDGASGEQTNIRVLLSPLGPIFPPAARLSGFGGGRPR